MRNSDRVEMNDVIDFLGTWLEEDEAAAKAAGGAQREVGPPNRRIVVAPWKPGERWSQPEYVAAFVAQDPLADGCRDHIVRHDPARVLRELAVVRQVVADFRAADGALIRGNYDDADPGWRGIRARRDAYKTVLMAYAKAAGWTPEQL